MPPKPPTFPSILKTRWSCDDPKKRFEIHNPATGEVITTLQAGDAATASQAIEAAQQAFETDWRWRTSLERGQLLLQCAAKLEEHAEELAVLLCMENGKPFQDALAFDVRFLVAVFRYFGSLIDKLPGEFYDQGSVYTTVIYEPHGVCAGILPFNWPPIHTGGKLAPALAAGNTMILKPGEQAPLTALRIVEIVQQVLPKDVVQIVPGLGPEVPSSIVEHPKVRMVSFTGSTPAGAAVGKTAAPSITPTVMELGGKNAFIVFEDADFDRAVRDAIEGAFFNKGEACTASSRLLVQRSIYEKFIDKLSAGVRKVKAGNGMDSSTHVGPCVSKAQQEKVLGYIKQGEELGAKIAAQGQVSSDEKCKKGFFVPPTLFRDVTRDMIIAQEEMFGPVVTVTPFDTEDEALSIANESRYGLVGCIYSRDIEKCQRAARKIDVGMVFINQFFRNILGTPFGGTKHSGHGREHCIATLKDWSYAKSIKAPSGLAPVPHWRGVNDIFGESGSEVVAVNGA